MKVKKRPMSTFHATALRRKNQVKALVAQGVSLSDIAYTLGISVARVGQIRRELESKGEI